VVGGRSEGAYRRTARYASGWYGFNLNLEQTQSCIAAIAQAVDRYERPAELGPVEITIAPSETLTPALIEAYEAAGVGRLLLRLPVDGTLADAEQVIQENSVLAPLPAAH
jgi:alkanesulfonate monooxygenase SsuD/methylene tetrahydromethanopterin reductase-like flavin-dependent oxidoreductase (luciferase family)